MRILIVDDDTAFRGSLVETLRDLDHDPIEAASARQALTLLRGGRVDAAIIDCRMPDRDGLDLLRDMRAEADWQALPVVMLTGFATPLNTIEAMRLGAVDHITKPIGRQQLIDLLQRLAPADGASATTPDDQAAHPLIGASPAMRDVHKHIGIAASSDCTVLIRGETGTGKEVVARLLHTHSARSGWKFVALNCAAIPPDLLESELFGHVRGAFTGAIADRPGAFREAAGGTLFLDEIGDMEPAMQAKLLRVIEERTVTPVGSNSVLPVDVRLIAATHRDLAARIDDGAFRRDLLYRLNVVAIDLPPLRDRGEDVLLLAEHFIAESGKSLTTAARRRLMAHPWPGNVRELRNACHRAGLMTRGRSIDLADLGFLDEAAAPAGNDIAALTSLPLPEAVRTLEAMMIRETLARSAGNKAEAARRLGISRQLLYAKLLELDPGA